MKLKEDQSILLNNEIVSLRKGNSPEKIFDEGDSFGIENEVSTHSFYWAEEPGKENDFEPIAFSNSEECYFSRLHYHGLVVWKDYVIKNGKGIAYFLSGFHTPQMCSVFDPFWLEPNDIKGIMALYAYFLPALRKNKLHKGKYETTPYPSRVIEDGVLNGSKFLWKDFFYYVIIASKKKIDELKVSEALKKRLHDIAKS